MVDTNTYTYLEPDVTGGNKINTGDPTSYFKTVYSTALTLTVVFALIMVVVAGVEYTTSFASPSAKNDASHRMWNAIGGLVLALMSYLLLTTINPDLLTVHVPNGSQSTSK